MSHDAYSALSDPTRRRILTALRGGPRPVGELVTELQVSQPTVSKHLKVLRDAGMVATRAQGQKRFYNLTAEPFVAVLDWVNELVAAADAADTPVTDTHEPAPAESDEPAMANDVAAEPAVDDAAQLTKDASAESTDHDAAQSPEDAPGPEPVRDEAADVDAAQEPVREPERSLPWFTAEVTDITTEAAEATTTPDAPEVTDIPAPAETLESPVGDPRPEENPGEAETLTEAEVFDESDQGSEEVVQAVSGVTEELVISTDPEGPADEREAQDTGDSVDDGAHAEPAAQPRAAHDAEPHDTEPRAVSPEANSPEIAELIRPRGAAHRRQSGLLSTLTGFRRRNRGSRRG
ncbi:metalloregulator ArsR/SmtB family transcription factor [Kocuria indica]|uniref:Metalloregulator ArsR/SmtB family transcription factor n=1 Tax=Kocuria marina subsp. indica TaxID=1049583 RepID=A0A6N9QZC3_9MICC|nr:MULTISPECIES: metalloregulator ArsR/SmtB family transcription factor [Kocuria]MCT1615680.1 metalloregulator ArsR/SmtB family transcription factor [Kocuria marina]NDO78616.1 metalloregulator ArsR/SmtB family transcription factor [Kocuria indica]